MDTQIANTCRRRVALPVPGVSRLHRADDRRLVVDEQVRVIAIARLRLWLEVRGHGWACSSTTEPRSIRSVQPEHQGTGNRDSAADKCFAAKIIWIVCPLHAGPFIRPPSGTALTNADVVRVGHRPTMAGAA